MRILFTFIGGSGHFRPLMPVARGAQAAGHTVAVALPVRAGGVPRSQPPGSLPSPRASRADARKPRTARRCRHPIRKRMSGSSRRASPGAGHGGMPRQFLSLPVRGSPMCWCVTRSTSAPRSRPNRSHFPARLSSCSRPGAFCARRSSPSRCTSCDPPTACRRTPSSPCWTGTWSCRRSRRASGTRASRCPPTPSRSGRQPPLQLAPRRARPPCTSPSAPWTTPLTCSPGSWPDSRSFP
jgi:hypothetical protein